MLAMRWDDVDLTAGVWSKPPSSTKQKDHHEAQLSAPARQLLSEIRKQQVARNPKKPLGEYVFPGPGKNGHVVDIKKSWRQLCRVAKITALRLHDLRHSFASQAISGGASLPLVGALLGHASPTTTARYAHMFTDPQRAAVERIGAVITAAGKPVKSRPGSSGSADMAKGWGPAHRLSPIGDIEMARAPTQNELEELLHQLMEWRGAHAECMRPELWREAATVHRVADAAISVDRRKIQLMRWSYVGEGRDRLGMSWEELYEYASDVCQGTPAQAGAEMMEKSYDEVQRELPPAQRRQRT